ncbi:MAG: hypothetical protein EAZ61_11125 [Oscillatoriales cyanobacterium]|nr:MAG: hypothetical protein EAZ61_11125 [Oscillatoriales cyanobacterium]
MLAKDFVIPHYLNNFFLTDDDRCKAIDYINSEVKHLFFDVLDLKNISFKYIEDSKVPPYFFDPRVKEVTEDFWSYELFEPCLERDNNGRLAIKPLWTITLDLEVACVQVRKQNYSGNKEFVWDWSRKKIGYMEPKSNAQMYRAYNCIYARKTPLLFYVHFTLQELIDCVKPSRFKAFEE